MQSNRTQYPAQATAQHGDIIQIFLSPCFAQIRISEKSSKKKKSSDGRHDNSNYFEIIYLPRQNLKTNLTRILAERNYKKIENLDPSSNLSNLNSVHIFSSYLNKLFPFRLGGGVSHLISNGFTDLETLSQSELKTHVLNPQQSAAIYAQDLVLSWPQPTTKEPIGELGKSQLTNLIEKMRAADSKRVCVHLTPGAYLSSHLEMITSELVAAGMKVFVPKNNQLSSANWRRNSLAAAFAGTFEDLQSELHSSFAPYISEKEIYFLDNMGNLISSADILDPTDVLFSQQNNFTNFSKPHLYLGLEKFILFPSNQHKSNLNKIDSWNSPWGKVDIQSHIPFVCLKTQPTQKIELNHLKEIDYSAEYGFEPGPLFFGRNPQPLLADLCFYEKCPENLDQIINSNHTAKMKSAFESHILSLARNNPNYLGMAFSEIHKLLLSDLSQRIQFEVENHMDQPLEELSISGLFAKILFPKLSQNNHNEGAWL